MPAAAVVGVASSAAGATEHGLATGDAYKKKQINLVSFRMYSKILSQKKPTIDAQINAITTTKNEKNFMF